MAGGDPFADFGGGEPPRRRGCTRGYGIARLRVAVHLSPLSPYPATEDIVAKEHGRSMPTKVIRRLRAPCILSGYGFPLGEGSQ